MRPGDLLARATSALLAQRTPGAYWEGHLSSSALSTATAVAVLALYEQAAEPTNADRRLIDAGLGWLIAHRNRDGGWGDTVASASNISTTLLVWAALAFARHRDESAEAAARGAEAWIARTAGGLDAPRLAGAVAARYGRDRTFSVPILTMCALAGRLGAGAEAWRVVPALPFELAAAPRGLFASLRLPVVSYALPALIAMGLVRHRRHPTRNPAARLARNLTAARVLRVLETLQPPNGGFLEATPLTSFVAMSLVGAGEHAHLVVQRALQFVRTSVRSDGSWPIDTHLATWVTTLAVKALQDAGALSQIDHTGLIAIRRWLIEQQHTRRHAYTGASPGGWAWTPLPGGVPDADDTAGAVLALAALPQDEDSVRAATAGIGWLLSLQNRDGGIPTFCRGWGALPFDRSGADLTAHAIRAWDVWLDRLEARLRARVGRAIDRATRYLQRSQRSDGAFIPLWFGNESSPGEANPTYGTARVITAHVALKRRQWRDVEGMLDVAVRWLLAARNTDGGWGGDRGVPSSVEETALALGALADVDISLANGAIADACAWIAATTADGTRFHASPIGLYFARLWYSESLYPLVFTVDGVARACRDRPPGLR